MKINLDKKFICIVLILIFTFQTTMVCEFRLTQTKTLKTKALFC